ncbi:hypothetical protein [Oceanirhabdus sp. W0125-5]|uniref:hypothetical protein n=1 Tax=Oceanirhabdus sp. W0125-5 TaxID=2999116 RepID=UPI0022F3454B|nr:hypothetical protein [Oceanirhabdus sp. W0125-5]WBW98378.1 hypothetical protein OW730_06310 [Oceanirhabdus sp. W0125-5]
MIKKLFNKKNKEIDYRKYIPNHDFDSEISAYEAEKDLGKISTIYWALLLEDKDLKRRAINSLSDTIDSLNRKKLILLDKIFRSTTSYSWSYEWESESVNSLLDLDMSQEEKINIIGLSTFHPNGYFREKALDELFKIDSNKILPFIIIRTNDWVDVIREKSIKYLIEYISKENFVSIMEHFTLFKHTAEYSRGNSYKIMEEINQLGDTENLTEEILTCLKCRDNHARDFCYKILINRRLIDSANLINIILKEPIAKIRGKAIEKIIKTLSDEKLYSLKDIFLNDKGYKVREIALTELFNRGYFDTPVKLEFALVDKYYSVRELARYYMRKLGFKDFIKFYTERLQDSSTNEHALLGLAEVATINEIDILKSNLNYEKIPVVKKLLKSLSIIDFNLCESEVIDALNDERVGISNEAKEYLSTIKGCLTLT